MTQLKWLKKMKAFSSLDAWLGKKQKVDIYVKDDIYITVPKRKKNKYQRLYQNIMDLFPHP